MKLNLFDKICAVLAFALAVIFLLLGGLGIIFGCKTHFTLPPILGGLPLLVGWGIIKPVLVAWKNPPPSVPAPFMTAQTPTAVQSPQTDG